MKELELDATYLELGGSQLSYPKFASHPYT
jgi:hypothetical protein